MSGSSALVEAALSAVLRSKATDSSVVSALRGRGEGVGDVGLEGAKLVAERSMLRPASAGEVARERAAPKQVAVEAARGDSTVKVGRKRGRAAGGAAKKGFSDAETGMGRPEEISTSLAVLRARNWLDPSRHYKTRAEDSKRPEKAALGTVQASPFERQNKKRRKAKQGEGLLEQFMADEKVHDYTKRQEREVAAKGAAAGVGAFRKAQRNRAKIAPKSIGYRPQKGAPKKRKGFWGRRK